MPDNVYVSDSIVRLAAKTRIISEAVIISDGIAAYKNGVLIEPQVEVLAPSSLLGTREHRVRLPRRAPKAIVIDEISNVATAPLKVLAFSDGINKAIVAIRPRPSLNVARSRLLLTKSEDRTTLAYSHIKTQLEPIPVKARLALLSSPIGLGECRLKLRPQIQTIESLKAINADRIDKLHKLAMLSMMLESV